MPFSIDLTKKEHEGAGVCGRKGKKEVEGGEGEMHLHIRFPI